MLGEQKTNKPLRLGAVYIRESTENQDKGFSPENQERTIREYAKRNNIKIVEVYKDLVSGTSVLKRDNFLKMMNSAENKNFDIVLVYHTSRFARNVKEARKYKEHLREILGIDVMSVTQYFGDWNDPSGFLNECVNEIVDAYNSKVTSFWVRTTLMEKRRRGLQSGNPPFGYYKKKLGFDKETGRILYEKTWRIDDAESKIVVEIFEMYKTGNHSYADIAEKINKLNIKTKYGNPFTYSSIKDILKNKVYLGYVYSPRKQDRPIIEGKHPSIISPTLFNEVQDMINQRRGTKGRPVAQHRFYLLQGLVYCYHCYKHIEGKENKPTAKLLPRMYCHRLGGKNGNEYLMYACKFRKENKSCNQINVKCETIDNQVIKFMEGFSLSNDIIQLTLDKLKKLFEEPIKSVDSVEDSIKRVKFLENKKRKLNFQYTNTEELSDDEYIKQLNNIHTELKSYADKGIENKALKINKNDCLKETEEFLKNFKAFWRSLDKEEKRKWIQMTIKRVWVKDKKVVAIEPKDEYKALFSIHRKVLGQVPIVTPIIKNGSI